MMYRLKKDVADCTRHQTFMKDQKIGIKAEKLEKEYRHATYVTQAYLEATQLYLRGEIARPPWHTLFVDGITEDKEEKECLVPLSQGGNILKESKLPPMRVPFRHYITLTPVYECHVRNIPYSPDDWKNSAGGKYEYIGEFRSNWRCGGANLNIMTSDTEGKRVTDNFDMPRNEESFIQQLCYGNLME